MFQRLVIDQPYTGPSGERYAVEVRTPVETVTIPCHILGLPALVCIAGFSAGDLDTNLLEIDDG